MTPQTATTDTFCSECHRRIRYYPDRKEWGHVQIGAGAWLYACKTCYWKGAPHPAPSHCPVCLEDKLLDLHLASPETSTPRREASV